MSSAVDEEITDMYRHNAYRTAEELQNAEIMEYFNKTTHIKESNSDSLMQ